MAVGPLANIDPRDVAAIDLERILQRLDHKVLSPEADPQLQHSSYERSKTRTNLEYARTLLLRLEHDASNIKIQSRKASTQTSLSAQRTLIKRLTDRVHDLDRTGDDYELLSPSDGIAEDLLAEYDDPAPPAPAPAKSANSRNNTPPATDSQHASAPNLSPSSSTALSQPAESTSVLRNRLFNNTTTSPNAQATATGSSHNSTSAPSTTQLLETSTSTQTDLTASLLSLATQLKLSSNAFSTSLEADTTTLNRAVEGLDKNTSGMEAAGKRMGMLKRMSEGKGLWGRLMLYAWIAGLWVVAILLVFVGPKLRF